MSISDRCGICYKPGPMLCATCATETRPWATCAACGCDYFTCKDESPCAVRAASNQPATPQDTPDPHDGHPYAYVDDCPDCEAARWPSTPQP